ncbi:cysteine proteinase [Thozetella sp. PMI_491]|nr:cysteine proteinase [Thozetella sp. PMI_491]
MAGSTVVLDHGGDGTPMNGSTKGYGMGAADGGRPGKRTIPHIDDITSVTVSIDAHAPVEKVIQQAENYLRQAESAKSFGREDWALKDYIRASTIVVDMLKKNKGWSSLQDNRNQHDRYQRLARRITALHGEFEKIKADIKADNARTGVQPTSSLPSTGQPTANGDAVRNRAKVGPLVGTEESGGATENGVPGAPNGAKSNGGPSRSVPPAVKTKPVIHPKPQSLHGNAIKSPTNGAAPTSKTTLDLAQRFANLRMSTSGAAQDPRIRTQAIVPPRASLESRDPPPRHQASVSLDTAILPELPKLPDAIYSPARGTVSNEAAQLPSSTPRGMFSRTNSMTSFQPTSKSSGTRSPPPEDYFVPAHSFGGSYASTPSAPKRPKPSLPTGDTITAQELVQYMQAGSKVLSILLIDIRSRQEFEEGHIMSQAIMCIDSEILLREHISASQIADSLVLAPTAEQLLFEKRHEFDLVVFYDAMSGSISQNPHTTEGKAILGLYNALVHFDFGTRGGSRMPKLLAGGIEAWTSLMGPVSLQTSGAVQSSGARKSLPIPRGFGQRRQKFVARPIQDPEEAKRWELTLDDMEAFSPIKTTDEFLRRYPAVSTLQESMTAPVSPTKPTLSLSMSDPSSYQEHLYSSLPSPPARPPPAVPRPNYSGLADTEDSQGPMLKLGAMAAASGSSKKRTGLHNPRFWCYANSSLQSLFSTAGFSAELSLGTWSEVYKVPKKADEKIQQPQLLIKFLANLFHWMQAGNFATMEAKSLMDYIRHVNGKNIDGTRRAEADTLGGKDQQDSQEYIHFIITHLHDETNLNRNKKWDETSNFEKDPRSTLEIALHYWTAYQVGNNSIVDKYFRGVEAVILQCDQCKQVTRNYQVFDFLCLPLQKNRNTISSLQECFEQLTHTERPEGITCEECEAKNSRSRRTRLARLPDRLILQLNRFRRDGAYVQQISKNRDRVNFPIRGLDMSPYFIDSFDRKVPDNSPNAELGKTHQFRGPFIYDLYAAIVHTGSTNHSGHYWSYAKDDSSRDVEDWWKLNDAQVSQIKVSDDEKGCGVFMEQGAEPYVLFYRRRNT